jgi:hypothetical protein
MARTRHRDRAEAFNLGAAGENAPDWVMADPSLLAAFDQGQADGARGPAFHPPTDKPKAPSSPAPRPPASSGGGKTTTTTKSGSDGSGMLLALLVYPMFLALVKSGPSGVGVWLRAKFLNQTTTYAGGDWGPNSPAPSGGNSPAPTPSKPAARPQGPIIPTPAR